MATVNASYNPNEITPEVLAQVQAALGIAPPQTEEYVGANVTPGAALLNGAFANNPQFQAQQAELARRVQEGTQGLSPQQYAQYQQLSAQDDRYGNDLSWLDPSFQYQANQLGQSAGSQAYADPSAIAYQNSAMQQAQQLANSNLSFMSGDQQQSIMNSILGVRAPQFQSDAQQQQALSAINAVNMPHFAGAGTQQDVLNRALGLASNSGPGALSFDTSGRQGEQYGNLQGIIAGGGADAIEMARRQAARADSESWLRGQREADMADYAERGLTGSGMELLNLAADRQAAAGRNSAADLQTAAALEERRLGAINSAAGLATNMRGQTIDEQGLLNNRATAGLGVAGSLANSMRSSDIQEQLGLTEAALNKAVAAGSLSSTMRGQTASEQLGLNSALLNQFNSAGNLANTMRSQTANEQLGNRQAQLSALGTLASSANTARGQSAQEAQYRAGAADDFSVRNQQAINSAAAANTAFTQNAYQQMMNNRQQWASTNATNNANLAISQQNFDASENNRAASQAQQVGMYDANARNIALQNLQNALMGTSGMTAAQQLSAQQAANQIYGQMGAWTGDVAGTVGSMGINAASGAGSAGGGGAAAGASSGASVDGGYGTNLGNYGSGLNVDWSKLKLNNAKLSNLG